METWQKVWRQAVVPLVSTVALEALKRALLADSPDLIQGATTSPPPLEICLGWPVEACCPLTFLARQGQTLGTVREAEDAFARLGYEIQ